MAQYIDWTFANHPLCTGQAQNFLSQKTVDQRRDICSPRDFAPLPDHLFKFNEEGILEDISTKERLEMRQRVINCSIEDLIRVSEKYLTGDSKKSILAGEAYREEASSLGLNLKEV